MTDRSYKISDRVCSSVLTHDTLKVKRAYHHGFIKTPEGIVGVYMHGDASAAGPFTALDFVHDSRCYQREYKREFSKRGLSMIARRFAVDVIAGCLK